MEKEFKMKGKSLAVFLILVMVSCLKTTNTIPLEQKVKLYWKARMTGNYTMNYMGKQLTLYRDFLPQSIKKTISEKDFYKRLNFRILDFKIDSIKYNKKKDKATVSVLLTIDFQGYKLDGVVIKDKWVKENGDWKVMLNLKSNPFE